MAPKKKIPKKGTPKKETPKQTPKETFQIGIFENDIPKIQTPKIETHKKETPQKATFQEHIPREVPESIKSVSNAPLKQGPLNDMFPGVQVPQGRKETPTKEPSKKTSNDEIPKKGIFRPGCYSCAKKETAKKVFPRNVSPEDEPPKNMFPDIGYPKKLSPNIKSPKKHTPKSEPPKKETRTTLDDAFTALEESIAKQQVHLFFNPKREQARCTKE
ncbi:MAG: hypothetical protein L6R38_007613 [Xanthoria sp. 2 TBL-2021]|nr:MAG: hypothetical protein L6R38_007613 [Xanthoria sp. 2 TBL-2021]